MTYDEEQQLEEQYYASIGTSIVVWGAVIAVGLIVMALFFVV